MICQQCGAALTGRATKFCSRECKDEWHSARRHAASLLRRSGRRCVQCGELIPDGGSGKAKTCSRECGVAWQNARRQIARRSVWEAVKQPCRQCGSEIPTTRRIGSLYCSSRCKHNATSATWRAKSSGYMRQYLYGVTPEQYADLLASQDGRCAICRTDTPNGKGGWHVDHEHATGRIRGLLCHSCNLMVGHAGDDPVRLRVAADYLT